MRKCKDFGNSFPLRGCSAIPKEGTRTSNELLEGKSVLEVVNEVPKEGTRTTKGCENPYKACKQVPRRHKRKSLLIKRREKEMRIDLKFKGKKINIYVKPCNIFEKVIGLMFSRREKAKALLLFNSNRLVNYGIHSFFVFFSFVAVWLDKDNEIVDLKIVKPFKFLIHSKRPFNKLIEIPINEKYGDVIKELIVKDNFFYQ